MDRTHPKSFELKDPIALYVAFDYIKKEILMNGNKSEACRDAARKFNIPGTIESIVKHYSRFMNAGERMDKRQWFSTKDEVTFCLILESFSLLDRPLSRKSFFSMVREYAGHDQCWNLEGWYWRFHSRFRDYFSYTTIKGLEMERAVGIDSREINEYVESKLNTIRRFRIPHRLIFNIDETRLAINSNCNQQKGLASTIERVYSGIIPNGYFATSYVPIIGMNSIYIHFLVVPGLQKNEIMTADKWESNNSENKQDEPKLPDLYVIKTRTGYMNKAVFHLIITKFVKKLRDDGISDHVLLVLDQLKQHLNEEMIKAYGMNHILTAFIPTHTTHFYQPLDNLCFQAMKKKMDELYGLKTPTASPERSINLELHTLLIGINNIITRGQIESSWRNTGLIPLNSSKLRKIVKPSLEANGIPINFPDIKKINGENKKKDAKENKKRGRKATSSQLNCSNDVSSDAIVEPKVNKKQKIESASKLGCFCQFHNFNTDGAAVPETTPKKCYYCHVFIMCIVCYNEYPEVFDGHMILCKSLTEKRNKKATAASLGTNNMKHNR